MAVDASGRNESAARVRQHYEELPYPAYDPNNPRANVSPLDILGFLQMAYWPRRASLAGAKVLDVGCGTGAEIASAALQHPQAQIIGVDISEASLRSAADRAERCGAKNARFACLGIDDLDRLEETFDVITMTGVFMILEDPAAALQAMARVLKPDGIMLVATYGRYGRYGVRLVQELFERLKPKDPTREYELALAQHLLEGVPSDHIFRRQPWKGDLDQGRTGLGALMLHSDIEQVHTVRDVDAIVGRAGLRLVEFLPRALYDPGFYLKDPEVRGWFAHLKGIEAAAAAELLHPQLGKHTFVVARPSFKFERLDVEGDNWASLLPRVNPQWGWKDEEAHDALPGLKGIVATRQLMGLPHDVLFQGWERIVLELCRECKTLSRICSDDRLKQSLRGVTTPDRHALVRSMMRRAMNEDVIYLTA